MGKENFCSCMHKNAVKTVENDGKVPKNNYIDRMKVELYSLSEKVDKLYLAIKTLDGLTADELGLMYAQYYAMKNYEEILRRRIDLAYDLEMDCCGEF